MTTAGQRAEGDKFRPTHTLTWHGAQIEVSAAPWMAFKFLGKGGLRVPAYTRDEWDTASTARWTTDSKGNWYLSGQRAKPLVRAASAAAQQQGGTRQRVTMKPLMTMKPQKTPAQLQREIDEALASTPSASEPAIDKVRRLMQWTDFDDDDPKRRDRPVSLRLVSFSSREGSDIAEGIADPKLIDFAEEKAKEIEAAVPGTKASVESLDEWVIITVKLPPE